MTLATKSNFSQTTLKAPRGGRVMRNVSFEHIITIILRLAQNRRKYATFKSAKIYFFLDFTTELRLVAKNTCLFRHPLLLKWSTVAILITWLNYFKCLQTINKITNQLHPIK